MNWNSGVIKPTELNRSLDKDVDDLMSVAGRWADEQDPLCCGRSATLRNAIREVLTRRGYPTAGPSHRKLDNSQQVFFYEQEFYVLSNYSAFSLVWKGIRFDTSEAAYHWEKFPGNEYWVIRGLVQQAPSAHDAQKIAETYRDQRRPDWEHVRTTIMHAILLAKVEQHEYVRRKLLETGDRELIEDSWRDAFWGWGPDRNGQNMLGKLWMSVRHEIRNKT